VSRKLIGVTCSAVFVAAGLLSCSDDEWDVDIFRWPPLERSVNNGEVEVISDGAVPKVVVRLRGTPEAMGYAHGELLGPQIVRIIDEFAIPNLIEKGDYEEAHRNIFDEFVWPDEYTAELNAMYEGMRDSGTDLTLSAVERELDVNDLAVWNAYFDWDGDGMGEAFAVWGADAQWRHVIVGRNFDVDADPLRLISRMWAVFVYDAGGNPYAAISPPGYIGALSGVSKRGVAVAANKADLVRVRGPQDPRGVLVGLLMREFLRTADPAARPDDRMLNLVQNNRNYRAWCLLGASVGPGGNGGFGWVVECDSKSDGGEIRYNDPAYRGIGSVIWATESFRKRSPRGSDEDYQKLRNVITRKLKSGPLEADEADDVLVEMGADDEDNAHAFAFFKFFDGFENPRTLSFAVSDGSKSAVVDYDFHWFAWKEIW
jgi:hypothetical protein